MAVDHQLDRLEGMVSQVSTQVSELSRELRDVHDRLVRLESKDMAQEIILLQQRVAILEADYHRRQGALTFGNRVPQLAGWLVAGFGFLYYYFKAR